MHLSIGCCPLGKQASSTKAEGSPDLLALGAGDGEHKEEMFLYKVHLQGRGLSHSTAKESRPGEVCGSFKFLFDKHGVGSGSGSSEAKPKLCVSMS